MECGGGYKLVPWINWDEWTCVRQSLFSSSPESVASALTRISAWRSRGHVPIEIEITASIIEIQQKDPFFRLGLHPNSASNSEEMLAMLYCMAIMRLVNAVVEKNRKKTEVSIAVEAHRIGLPRMLIDIRHETSHRDLPSLQLVRLASIEALNWLKSFYWEPQKNVIPFQRDKITHVRKEIKLRLRELAFYLYLKQASQSGSSSKKRRRTKQAEVIYGRNNFFSHKAGKLQGSNSQGPKGQVKRTLQMLVGLYSCFPSEVVAALLEFLMKVLDSIDGNDVDPPDTSGLDKHISGNWKTPSGTTEIWKLIITRFSSKEPELILIMLKALLEMIETREATKLESGRENLAWSKYKVEVGQIEHLSSLVVWLLEKYKRVGRPSQIVCGGETRDSSDETNVNEVTLTEVLKKCLMVFSPGNGQLAESALLHEQMFGNSLMFARLKKLSLLSSPNLGCAEESRTGTDDSLLQENSIAQARQTLDFLKRLCGIKGKIGVGVNNDESRWRVAKSWKPCPIGMLPCGFHSAGVIPILNKAFKVHELQQTSEREELCGLDCCDRKVDASSYMESEELEDSNPTKTLSPEEHRDSPLEPFKGRLLIDGVLQKIGEEELLAIEAAVRILL